MSGSTAPSIMAVRTDSSASSGRTIMAGGGRRPMRCSAASTSVITRRRPSSDNAQAVFALRQCRAGASSVALTACLDVLHARGRVDQALIELAAIVAERRRFPS